MNKLTFEDLADDDVQAAIQSYAGLCRAIRAYAEVCGTATQGYVRVPTADALPSVTWPHNYSVAWLRDAIEDNYESLTTGKAPIIVESSNKSGTEYPFIAFPVYIHEDRFAAFAAHVEAERMDNAITLRKELRELCRYSGMEQYWHRYQYYHNLGALVDRLARKAGRDEKFSISMVLGSMVDILNSITIEGDDLARLAPVIFSSRSADGFLVDLYRLKNRIALLLNRALGAIGG